MTSKIKFHSFWDFGGMYNDSMMELLEAAGMQHVYDPKHADIIVFNGGADIGTEIYGEKPVFKGIPEFTSTRDKEELALYKEFQPEGKFLLGICRGAQLLNCLNGGSLWQHVDNHQRTHDMVDVATGKQYRTTSTHHQMMRPTKDAKIIAVANEAVNKHADNVHRHIEKNDNEDIEIVWYGKTRSLCIQGHPEYVPGSEFANYCLRLIDTYRKVA